MSPGNQSAHVPWQFFAYHGRVSLYAGATQYQQQTQEDTPPYLVLSLEKSPQLSLDSARSLWSTLVPPYRAAVQKVLPAERVISSRACLICSFLSEITVLCCVQYLKTVISYILCKFRIAYIRKAYRLNVSPQNSYVGT